MAKRKSIPKKIRFEVFKRDSFSCQYCGRSAPAVVLHLDHVQPVVRDGDESVFNYITSCQDCNLGKGSRELSDDSTLTKQKAQLDDLQKRREQIEMMLQWRQGLKELEDDVVSIATNAWHTKVAGWTLSDTGQKGLTKLIKKYGLNVVLDAIDTAAESYLKEDENGDLIGDSVQLAFSKISGICCVSQLPDYKRQLYYFRGILRNRLPYINEWQCIQLLESAYIHGCEMDDLRAVVMESSNWTRFKAGIALLLEA